MSLFSEQCELKTSQVDSFWENQEILILWICSVLQYKSLQIQPNFDAHKMNGWVILKVIWLITLYSWDIEDQLIVFIYYRLAFDEDRVPDLTSEEYLQDVHSISSLLKMYFRELPNPLLTYQLYDKFAVSRINMNIDGWKQTLQWF